MLFRRALPIAIGLVCIGILANAQSSAVDRYLSLWPDLEVLGGEHLPLALVPSELVLERRPESQDGVTVLLTFRLTPEGPLFELQEQTGILPPFDTMAIFQRMDDGSTRRVLDARVICVSPIGNVYAEIPLGRNGSVGHRITQKWIANSSGLREVQQPLYHIGVAARANALLELHLEPTQSSSIVARVTAGSMIVVVGVAEPRNLAGDWYLIRSVTGLTGWHQAEQVGSREQDDIFSISILDGNHP
jgi:hypothetical protein